MNNPDKWQRTFENVYNSAKEHHQFKHTSGEKRKKLRRNWAAQYTHTLYQCVEEKIGIRAFKKGLGL